MQPTVFTRHLTILSAIVLIAAGCSKPTPHAELIPTVIVRSAAPATPVVEAWNGTVRTRQHATLAFAVAGRLQKTCVEVGDHVAAGTVLAELDQEPFDLELEQAEAQARAAGPALEEAKRRFEAEERLSANGATSRTDLDAATSAYAAARSHQQAAEATLGLARRQQRESRLLAPCAGRIAQRLVPTASVIAAGTPVIEFDSDGPAEVVLTLPASRVGTLAIGQEVRVTSGLSGGKPVPVTGQITHIGLRSLAGGVHEVLVRLPGNTPAFPGESVIAELALAESAAGVRLPLTAIQPAAEPGTGHVFVFDPQSQRLALRPVRYQAPHGADVLVSSGLRHGELVAVAGLPFLRDGQAAHAQQRE